MRGKYEKKKAKKKFRFGKWILIIAIVVLLAAVAMIASNPQLLEHDSTQPETTSPVQSDPVVEDTTEPSIDTSPVQIEQVDDASMDLGNGLVITDIGKYTGIFMEDGSDELVTGVLMIVVQNRSDSDLQYAQIQLVTESNTANFSLTTVPAGASIVVLEQNRLEYSKDFTEADAFSNNVAWFREDMTLCEDLLKIQTLKDALNISNISGKDITGDIIIYYKNSSADMLYGGITYRVRITGGLKADEIRQIMADHFSENGSSIMFVTCG